MYTENKAGCPQRDVRIRAGCCGCREDVHCTEKTRMGSWGLVGYPLAMVYAPIQAFEGIYSLDEGLKKGTIFEALDLPFLCGEGSKGGCSCD